VLFDLIFLGLFVAGWLICGGIPWLVLSVATRGHAGLQYLPLSMFAGIVAGLAVPLFGLDNATGLWVSFVAALVVPSLLLAARRLSLHSVVEPRVEPAAHGKQPE